MIVNIQGKIVETLIPRTGVSKTGNEWMSQEYVIEDGNEEKLLFSVFGKDKIDAYGLKVGSVAAVTVKIESTKWNDKWFTKASCTECITQQAPMPQPTTQEVFFKQAPQPTPQPQHNQPTSNSSMSADALPF